VRRFALVISKITRKQEAGAMERGTAAEGDVVVARREHILEIARSAGSVAVEDLAERLGVTPQTIRKDLNVLAGQSLLSRIHGGALVTSGVDNLAYDARRTVASNAKARIGAAAAALIPNGASLFVNIGTTTEAVAANFVHHRNLMVVSNNLNVVDTLSDHQAMELVCVGGKVHRRSCRGGSARNALHRKFSRRLCAHRHLGDRY
jgi:DeoR family glycerol-3-phosphate regulon repressor